MYLEEIINDIQLELNREDVVGWLKSIAGFTNASGGNFYIGVEDKTKIAEFLGINDSIAVTPSIIMKFMHNTLPESAPSHCDCRNNQATEARMSPLSAGIQPGRIRCRIRPVPECSNLLTFRNRNRMSLGYNETGPILSSSARIAINVTVQIINLSNHSFPQSSS